MEKKAAQSAAVKGSYRAHKAAVMAALRRYARHATRNGVDRTWYRCLSRQGLDVVIEYIRENTSDSRTAAEVRDLIHKIGAPDIRGLPKAKRAATAIRVEQDGTEDVTVVCIGILPYAKCVWENLLPVTIDVQTLDVSLPVTPGSTYTELYITGVPPVPDVDDPVENMVAGGSVSVPHRFVSMAMKARAPALQEINLDDENFLVDEATYRAALAADTTDELAYKRNRFDCDKFALRLMANLHDVGITGQGVVIDYSAGHAYSIAALLPESGEVGEDNLPRIVVVEPQSDRFVELGSGDYTAESGYVLW